MERLASIWNGPGGIGFIFALLIVLALAFLLRFVVPALILQARLRRAIQSLDKLTAPTPEMIAAEVMTPPLLAHLWREYAQTLHRQQGADGAHIRATAMAGEFFTPVALVDTPLKTEFYRHLPGILTGIGIIGTFAGLIAGLSHFEVNSDTDTVRLSLKNLIQGVGHAFQVSALAITLAMLATWVEKSLVTLAYRQAAGLAERIDSLFESGVEEEYLSRLVVASEHSARQAGDLQQALTGGLQKSLGAMLAEQQAAQKAQAEAMRQVMQEMATNLSNTLGQTLGRSVADAVGQTLREPLSRMAAAVESAVDKATASQGEVTARTLEPLLLSFANRMEGQAGQGEAGLKNLLAKNAESLNRMAGELGKVVARIEHMGQSAVSVAAEGLSNAGAGVGRAADNFAQASAQVGAQLLAASSKLAQAAADANAVMQGETYNREILERLFAEFKTLVAAARREASLSNDLVQRMEAAAQALAAGERQAGDYLEGINRVLGEAHQQFAENVERTLRAGNSQFHKEMALSVDYLKGAIEELCDALESLRSVDPLKARGR
ncbi:hypothetical protein AGMMS49545_09130 [Betaproteobacteria bacterium]|nr:hypothetical protein AGMMS49545_09130 [Betaproteobacteria bacterium]GHU44021.1 hypothetical protein AGMMS50289_11470 [Betaproteobacteria bacterium]